MPNSITIVDTSYPSSYGALYMDEALTDRITNELYNTFVGSDITFIAVLAADGAFKMTQSYGDTPTDITNKFTKVSDNKYKYQGTSTDFEEYSVQFFAKPKPPKIQIKQPVLVTGLSILSSTGEIIDLTDKLLNL